MGCRQIAFLILGVAVVVGACSKVPARSMASPAATVWQLTPSLKYDALCLLNVLSGDPYYLPYYQAEYDHFHPLFSAQEQAAFVELKHILKDTAGGIVSAWLTLHYSAVDDETLPDMIRTAHDDPRFERAAPALETALGALDRVGFAAYWEQTVKARIEARIAELSPDLPRYDIAPAIERHLGFALPSHTITIYVLAYSAPHDIRLTGLRFVTNVSWPFAVVLHSAIHEAMHPPYQFDDPHVRHAVEQLSAEPVIVDKVAHHDRSAGYNTARGYIEEDSVQALEQIVSEEFGVGRYSRWYWYNQDGGMHVLAPAIYESYKRARRQHPEPYSQWLVQAVDKGELQGAALRSAVSKFFFFLRRP